jgi:NAD(P)-dependent dehydrogenase (short-subunit alcohol dehydrogenase family)
MVESSVKRLEGKVILITGAGSGIGKACAEAYAREGAKVVAASQSRSSFKVVEAIVAAGGDAHAFSGDIADEAAVKEMIDFTVDTYGRIDVLHNNAAMTGYDAITNDRDVVSMNVELWDRTMAVNLRGPMLSAKYAIPHMLRQGKGNVITTGSTKALQGDLAQTAYGASKAAVHNLTYNIAAQYGKMGIRANVLMVGLILSDATGENMPPPVLDIMLRHMLTQKIGTPEDCAQAAIFLASDESSYTTGQDLHVDGGYFSHAPTVAEFRDLFKRMAEAGQPG